MCRIKINLTTTNGGGTSISSTVQGRYRKTGTSVWTTFTTNASLPQTPDIIVNGFYDLQILVTNNVGTPSNWSNTSTFEVSANCSPVVTPTVLAPTVAPILSLSIIDSTGTFILSWTAVSGATSYDIYRDGSILANGTSTTTGFIYQGTIGEFAYFKVAARNSAGVGPKSNQVSGTISIGF